MAPPQKPPMPRPRSVGSGAAYVPRKVAYSPPALSRAALQLPQRTSQCSGSGASDSLSGPSSSRSRSSCVSDASGFSSPSAGAPPPFHKHPNYLPLRDEEKHRQTKQVISWWETFGSGHGRYGRTKGYTGQGSFKAFGNYVTLMSSGMDLRLVKSTSDPALGAKGGRWLSS
eukprot:TRINITY_DN24927_c0_g1_i1.p1 TRINITY_DN24927_c0_g1~~TRINITY_DN24927_c0_g1_i1.p1  ORF type:complete len:190 (-),score=14.23 TRINITY_DN24927_c0_g1_i1:26-538(-)